MSVLDVDKESFKKEVLDEEKPVVVDFWADWCGPCKMIAPFLDEIAAELTSEVKIVKLNIDKNAEIATEFGVRSIPTLMIFKQGEMVETKVGALPKNALLQWIKKVTA